MEENKQEKIEEQKEKTLGDILSSIGKSSSLVAKTISLVILTGIAALAITYPGESIKIPKGSTLSHIAKQYGTTEKRLGRVNKIINPDCIIAGQYLDIYPEGSFGFWQMVYDRIDNWF